MNKRRNILRIRTVKAGAAPTRERKRQNGGVVYETVAWDANGKSQIARYRARWTSPLDAYHDYGLITGQEHRAGILFNQAYYLAVSSRGAEKERLNPRPADTRLTLSERILRDAYRLLSPFAKKAVIDICGHEIPTRDKIKLGDLKDGLGQLAQMWSVAASEVTEHRSKTI